MKEQSDFSEEKEQHKKTAIILIPGFRSRHLFDAVWNQLQQIKNIKSFELSQNETSPNIITIESFWKNKQSLHIYEINWAEFTYNKDFENQFYQLFLSFKVLFDSIASLIQILDNLICLSFKSKGRRYWQIFRLIFTALVLPFGFLLIPLVSIYLLLVNLVIFSSIIYNLLKDMGSNGITINVDNFIKIPGLFITKLNFAFELISRYFSEIVVSNFNTPASETLETTKIILSIILIVIWIVGIGFNSLFRRILELYDFTRNYCQDELLRIKIRQKILKTVNLIFLDPTCKDVVIITHSFGALLGAELLANIPVPPDKNIKFISLGNILAVVGIRYFFLIDKIIEKNQKYDWIDYYAWFDFVATKIPKFKKKLIQKTVKYKSKNWLSLITGKYHLVYFRQGAYVEKSDNKEILQEVLAEYDV